MKLFAILACAGSLAILSGCLIQSRSHTSVSGKYISPTTINEIEPGKTRGDFVVATLGDPNSKTALDDGSEVWRYDYRKRTHSSGSVFLLFGGDSSNEKHGSTYVVIRDGVVEKVWQD